MSVLKSHKTGFTIVELLIVIVIIAILASISVVAYSGVQNRARQAKIQNDIRNIVTAIHAARQSLGMNLKDVTGSTWTSRDCGNKPSGTDLAALPDTDSCIVRYRSAIDAISAASGMELGNIRDPWGRPYVIDENESETGPTYCVRDTVAMYAHPFDTSLDLTTPGRSVPLGGFTGCS